jgi:hypothetical protein
VVRRNEELTQKIYNIRVSILIIEIYFPR